MRQKIGLIMLFMAFAIYADGKGWVDIPIIPKPDLVDDVPNVDKFHVLIVEDSAGRSKLTREQLEAVSGTRLKGWLDANVGDGQWRILDDETDDPTEIIDDDPWWLEATKVKRDSIPWIVAANGSKEYSGPLSGYDQAVSVLEGVK